MKVIHTADWHLGQRFQNGHERLEEHRCFLHWLTGTIEARGVEVLVVAGDVFDGGSPAAAARQLYYDFLAGLQASVTCRVVVIVGGMGSVIGAAVGAAILGLAEAYGLAYAPTYSVVFTFVILILVLAFRPRGIMGRAA